MRFERSTYSMTFGALLAVIFGYQLVASWSNDNEISLLAFFGMVIGVGLAVVEYRRKSRPDEDHK